MATRLDQLVAQRFGLSRSAAREAIRNGRVDLDGERCDQPGRLVPPDAALRYNPHRPKARRVVGVPLQVLYEDREILIVAKPPGLLTLPTALHEPDTLLARVSRYLALRHGGTPYVGVVHRLDRDTSGALLFAKSPRALAAFQPLFRRHAIERQYLAIVEGALTRQQGTIRRPVVINPDRPRHRVARPGDTEALDAITHFRVVERFGTVATGLTVWLETGRTHQIRVHLASIGHPVVGDARYRSPHQRGSRIRFKRQALHAQRLGFDHPLTGRTVSVEAEPPADLLALIRDLRLRYGLTNSGG
ncbi:MAG: pseudouridine synthase [Isosphaeraceae bacterium]|jgi:23S rRNA pseudouridine1911/1915/1917 synthase|nr:MAG: pseudouridine synthase [Isosphaeraceae bacterium]